MGLKKLLTVSNRITIYQFITFFLIIIGFLWWGDNGRYIAYSLYKNEASSINYLEVISIYNFLSNSVMILCFINLLLFTFVIIFRSVDVEYENNLRTEAFIIALSYVNLVSFIVLLFMNVFLFVLPKLVIAFTIIAVFFLALYLASFRKLKSPAELENNFLLNILKELDSRLNKYNPGVFKLLYGILCLTSIFILGLNTRIFHYPYGKITIINYISTVIGFIGIIFLLLSRRYRMKKMDELQRLIQLERTNFVFNGITALILGFFILQASFDIKISFTDSSIPIVLIIVGSLYLVGNKYK